MYRFSSADQSSRLWLSLSLLASYFYSFFRFPLIFLLFELMPRSFTPKPCLAVLEECADLESTLRLISSLRCQSESESQSSDSWTEDEWSLSNRPASSASLTFSFSFSASRFKAGSYRLILVREGLASERPVVCFSMSLSCLRSGLFPFLVFYSQALGS